MNNDDELVGGLALLAIAVVLFIVYIGWYNNTSEQYGLVQNKWWTTSESCTDHKDKDGNFLYETCTTSYHYFFRTADGDFAVNEYDFGGIVVGHAVKFIQHGNRGWLTTPVATDIVDSPPTYLKVSN